VTTYHGRVQTVTQRRLGSTLTADVAAGAVTTLPVFSADAFDDDGGSVSVNGQVLLYTGANASTSTVTLAAGMTLTSAASEGDGVFLYDTNRGMVAIERLAGVLLTDSDEATDPVEAEVAQALSRQLPLGQRGDDGEAVLVSHDRGAWRVVDVTGAGDDGSVGIQFEADDFHVITAGEVAAGTVTFSLSHRPALESLVAFWRRTPQEPTEYTVDYDAQTITWPLSGFEKAGDQLWVHYAYLKGLRSGQIQVVDTTTAKLNANGTSLNVPISSSIQAGDLLVLACGRADAPSVTSGWTLIDRVTPAATGSLSVYSKICDGTETQVTMTGPTDLYAGVVVVLRNATSVASSSSQAVPAGSTYTPPTIGGDLTLAFVLFDGSNSGSTGEYIASIDGQVIANLNIGSGIWGLGAAEGPATFHGSLADGTTRWLGISVGASA